MLRKHASKSFVGSERLKELGRMGAQASVCGDNLKWF